MYIKGEDSSAVVDEILSPMTFTARCYACEYIFHWKRDFVDKIKVTTVLLTYKTVK